MFNYIVAGFINITLLAIVADDSKSTPLPDAVAVVKIGILVLDIGIAGSQQATTTADREGQQMVGSGHDTPFSINNLDCNKGQPMSCKSCLVSRKPDSSRCPCRLYLMLFVACLSTQCQAGKAE